MTDASPPRIRITVVTNTRLESPLLRPSASLYADAIWASIKADRDDFSHGSHGWQHLLLRYRSLGRSHLCQMSNTPLVAWSFALPSGSAIRPSATIGLFQWPLPQSNLPSWRPLAASYTYNPPSGS